MSGFLVRKVSRAKWDVPNGFSPGSIGADALVDIRTTSNGLSFWVAASQEPKDLDSASLALAAGGSRIDALDIAWVKIEEMEKLGIALERNEGITPVHTLRSSHVDAIRLDLQAIISVCKTISSAIREGRQFRRYSKAEVKKLLNGAIQNGLITVDDLSEDLKKALAPTQMLHP